MGYSPSAELFYGYQLEAESVSECGLDDDWEARLAIEAGHKCPYNDCPPGLDYEDRKEWLIAHRSELEVWHAVKRMASGGVTFSVKCHEDDPCYFVYVSDSTTRASSWEPEIVSPDRMIIAPHWNSQLEAFIAKFELETVGKPSWYLVPDYG